MAIATCRSKNSQKCAFDVQVIRAFFTEPVFNMTAFHAAVAPASRDIA
jgi:hypothetical protein